MRYAVMKVVEAIAAPKLTTARTPNSTLHLLAALLALNHLIVSLPCA